MASQFGSSTLSSDLSSFPKEEMAELTASIKSTLQAQGSLHAIRAQLRACVYGALTGKQLPTTAKTSAATPEARLALGLICDFLEFHDFQSTLLTAASEIFDWDLRSPTADLNKALNQELDGMGSAEPLLVQLLRQRRNGAPPNACTEDSAGCSPVPAPISRKGVVPQQFANTHASVSSVSCSNGAVPHSPAVDAVTEATAANAHLLMTPVDVAPGAEASQDAPSQKRVESAVPNTGSVTGSAAGSTLVMDTLRSRAQEAKREEEWVSVAVIGWEMSSGV